jgi:hypothetical protein
LAKFSEKKNIVTEYSILFFFSNSAKLGTKETLGTTGFKVLVKF